ncbi:MAG: TIGR03619 family F420-dependent LLM class oxidoreductase [Acidimicrobiales bacterium]
MRAQLSVGVATFGAEPEGGWRSLLDLARALDDAGIDRLVVPDHVVLGDHVDRYPWGRFPTSSQADWLEPLATIAAMAAATERIRFMTGILVAPLRPAVLLAKQAATIDVLSGGRLDLGVGVGWQPEEFAAAGVPFAQRGRLLDDGIAACRTLWAGGPLDVPLGDDAEDADGPTRVWCSPTPVQEPLPVWFSGTVTDRLVRRIAELGDGWIPIMGATVGDVADGVARLRGALADAGRDPARLQVRASPALVRDAPNGPADVDATLAATQDLVAAGATDVHVPLRAFAMGPDAGAMADAAHRLAAAFARAQAT